MITTAITIPSQFREEACSFAVDNQEVKGIITRPDAATAPKGGIIFSHGWSGFRSGPASIITRLAREFAKLGYVSIRFDYRGRGESQGDGLQATLTTMADDLVAATAAIKEREGIDKPIFCGLCSGGNVVVGTLKRIPSASKLLLMSVYPFSDGDAFGRDIHRTFHFIGVYWQKVWRKDTWGRLFKGDINISSVFNVIFGHLLKKNANKKKEGADTKPAESSDQKSKLPQSVKAAAVESRSQDKEPPKKHLANLRKDLPGIMIYGSADPDATAAMKYYGDYIKEHQLPIPMHVIEGANHNFSSDEWFHQALELLKSAL